MTRSTRVWLDVIDGVDTYVDSVGNPVFVNEASFIKIVDANNKMVYLGPVVPMYWLDPEYKIFIYTE